MQDRFEFDSVIEDEALSTRRKSIILSEKADLHIDGYESSLIYALGGDDYIRGMRGDDTIYGGDGNDDISGNADNDRIDGGEGNDSINGGTGMDYLTGGSGDDLIEGYDGTDTIDGGSGNDMIYGGTGADLLSGGDGDDVIYGEAGGNRLFGGAGNDTLHGGYANENTWVTGGEGADRFVMDLSFANGVGHGTMTVTDFEDGVDKILVTGGPLVSWDVQDIKGGALITYMGTDGYERYIMLQNVDASHIDLNDFIFS